MNECITKPYRHHAEIIQNHVLNTEQSEGYVKALRLAAVQVVSVALAE
jgi:hypothetical protein